MDEANIVRRSGSRIYVVFSTLAVLVAVTGFVAAAVTVWLMYAGGQFQYYWGIAVIAPRQTLNKKPPAFCTPEVSEPI